MNDDVSVWIEAPDKKPTLCIAGQAVIDALANDEARYYRQQRNQQIKAEFTQRAIFNFIMNAEER